MTPENVLVGNVKAEVLVYKDPNGVEGIYPVYPSSTATCAELYAPVDMSIPKNSIGNIPIGLGFDVPIGHRLNIYPSRELLAKGLFMYVTFVDFGDTQAVLIPCINLTGGDVILKKGDVVAHAGFTIAPQAENWSKKVSMQLQIEPDVVLGEGENNE